MGVGGEGFLSESADGKLDDDIIDICLRQSRIAAVVYNSGLAQCYQCV